MSENYGNGIMYLEGISYCVICHEDFTNNSHKFHIECVSKLIKMELKN